MTGRWMSRDPTGERGGENLYGFVGNDGVNRWDLLGQWTPRVREEDSWAETCAQTDDTWDDLADELNLERGEAQKWVKNYDPTPEVGKIYLVPNTVFFYSAKRKWYEKPPTNILSIWRNLFKRLEKDFQEAGYKTLFVDPGNSERRWLNGWKEDGIYAFYSASHGAIGVVFPEPDGVGVSPWQAKPPYKLKHVGIYACQSALKVVVMKPTMASSWKDHVSTNGGTFFGYTGSPSGVFPFDGAQLIET